MLREELVKIVESQETYFDREVNILDRNLTALIRTDINAAIIITGVRRSGKSTLLRKIYRTKKIPTGYLHFDDPRLISFQVDDFYKLEEIWKDKEVLQFDEIHKVPNWELYVRQRVERKLKISITGSNAHLMSSEMGTYLTGRHLTYELFPFSFKEYSTYFKLEQNLNSLNAYISDGGFPEAVIAKEPSLHAALLVDIIEKDIVVRKGLRNNVEIQKLALHLINNISRPFSFRKLANFFDISVKAVIDYIAYLEDVYLFFVVSKFDYSYKKQLNNPKKIYAIDHAFARFNSLQFSQDAGRVLENMVFIELRKKTKQVFYFEQNTECDFVTNQLNQGLQCFQVSILVTGENRDREVNGLLGALDFFKLDTGYIITLNQEDVIKIQNKIIHLIPFWKWAG
ncbi:MAG: ATP-binding protein [Saprospiraceae bacterium]